MSENIIIPKKVFIVPYRNRIQHKFFFSKHMTYILEDQTDYEIYYSHQCDVRTFNRGAVKNIGFLTIKNKYPNDYKNITFIFNDIDTIPFDKIFDYETTSGIVKHYYGFNYALGGIVVIKGNDFERINGYPCFWGWGMEDNVLQKRCNVAGLIIDRSIFYKIGSPEILQLFDGISRIICKKDPWRGEYDNGVDGLTTISKLNYNLNDKSENPNDNVHIVNNKHIFYINILTFLTYIPFESEEHYTYDLREPKRKIINPDNIRATKKKVVTTQDWTNIPYYPTTSEKRENIAKYLRSVGKQVPDNLNKQIQEDHKNDIKTDSFNNFQSPHNQPHNQPHPHPLPPPNQYPHPQPHTHTHPLPPPNQYPHPQPHTHPLPPPNQYPYPHPYPQPQSPPNQYPVYTSRSPYNQRLNYFNPNNSGHNRPSIIKPIKSRINLG
jgi:hypothetical protein